jgi:hypothetical protein
MQRVAEFHAKMAALCGWLPAALIDETSPCPEILLNNTAKYGHTALVLTISRISLVTIFRPKVHILVALKRLRKLIFG